MDTEILKTLNEIDYLCTEGCQEIKNMVSNDDDINIFIGNTRSGKSTIVNFIIETQLRAVVGASKNSFNIVKVSGDSPGPKIGIGCKSETKIPTSWKTNKISGKVVDAPGFEDNRGVVQDIANAFFIKELIKNAKSIKFILISDINDILTHNITQFTSFIGKMSTMLPNSESLHEGMCLIFTKDRDNHNQNDIYSYFVEKIIEQEEMIIENRQLIVYLTNNLQNIGFFRMPIIEGYLQDDIGSDIVDLIENRTKKLDKTSISDIKPGISLKSREFLLRARQSFSEKNDLQVILKFVEETFVDFVHDIDIDSIETKEQAKIIKDNIKSRSNKLKQFHQQYSSLDEMVDTLVALDINILKKVEDMKFRERLRFVEFVDNILEVQRCKIFAVELNGMFSSVKKTLSDLCSRVYEKLMQLSINEQIAIQKKAKEDFIIQQQVFKNSIDAMKERSEGEKNILKDEFEKQKNAILEQQKYIEQCLDEMKESQKRAKIENEEQRIYYEKLILQDKEESKKIVEKLEKKFESDLEIKEQEVEKLMKTMEDASCKQIEAIKADSEKARQEADSKQQEYIKTISEELNRHQEALRVKEKTLNDAADKKYEKFLQSFNEIEKSNTETMKKLTEDQEILVKANETIGKSIEEQKKRMENFSRESNKTDFISTLLSSTLPVFQLIASYLLSQESESTSDQYFLPPNNRQPLKLVEVMPDHSQQTSSPKLNVLAVPPARARNIPIYQHVNRVFTAPGTHGFYSNLPICENVASWEPPVDINTSNWASALTTNYQSGLPILRNVANQSVPATNTEPGDVPVGHNLPTRKNVKLHNTTADTSNWTAADAIAKEHCDKNN